ncbi:DNA-directed RNA polymerase subunit beta [Alkalihalobacillus sp. AL-G]|uniref:DNA-directed RNA polymerase subunit beta n=1 Tax=Alkalihalobacillus sp. AL-G TaxID=2926399 RepID=UPI002729D19B|nr:DNA-directed RNA polymerase subunit beta [Alkalihalobacillus sp. AL-G]WLD93123.1 DNA-directed RNA polymerase subunit beta [Alkalihalobacillus sp. AL-G]
MVHNDTEVKKEDSTLTPEPSETNENTSVKIETKQQVKEASSREERKKDELKKPRIRILPIWLRLIFVLLLFAAALAGGLAVGYGMVGDGNMMDVFEKETWLHIIDLVKKDLQ